MKTLKYINIALIIMFLSSCAVVVRPGEVGVKRKFGKLKDKTIESKLVMVNPLSTRIIKIPIRTVNKEVKLELPSKEGLNVAVEISILYHVEKEKVFDIINGVGKDYEKVIILSTFRSAAADVSAQFLAKDMHSGMRDEIEKGIKDKMTDLLKGRGIVIESVLMKSISLPEGLLKAIEDKLSAEQDAQRKIIEAEGNRDAQKILAEGLTDKIIKFRTIEAFEKLSNSPNSKTIITDGKTPLLIQ